MSEFNFETPKEEKTTKPTKPVTKEPKAKEPMISGVTYQKLIFGLGLLATIFFLHLWFTFLMNIAYRGVLSTIVFFVILGVVIKLTPVAYRGIFSKK